MARKRQPILTSWSVSADQVASVFTPGLRTTRCYPTVSPWNGTVHSAIPGEDSITLLSYFLQSKQFVFWIRNRRRINESFHPSVKLNSRLISVSSDCKSLYVGGQLDNSVKVLMNSLIGILWCLNCIYFLGVRFAPTEAALFSHAAHWHCHVFGIGRGRIAVDYRLPWHYLHRLGPVNVDTQVDSGPIRPRQTCNLRWLVHVAGYGRQWIAGRHRQCPHD